MDYSRLQVGWSFQYIAFIKLCVLMQNISNVEFMWRLSKACNLLSATENDAESRKQLIFDGIWHKLKCSMLFFLTKKLTGKIFEMTFKLNMVFQQLNMRPSPWH